MNAVPEYSVVLANHIITGMLSWTPMQREGLLTEAEKLGTDARTRHIREAGGQATWVAVGDYHMTYKADPESRVVTVVAALPCLHKKRTCLA